MRRRDSGNVITGQFCELDRVLADRGRPPVDEEPRPGRNTFISRLREVQSPRPVQGLNRSVQAEPTNISSIQSKHRATTNGIPMVEASSNDQVPSGITKARSANVLAYSENAPRSFETPPRTDEATLSPILMLVLRFGPTWTTSPAKSQPM